MTGWEGRRRRSWKPELDVIPPLSMSATEERRSAAGNPVTSLPPHYLPSFISPRSSSPIPDSELLAQLHRTGRSRSLSPTLFGRWNFTESGRVFILCHVHRASLEGNTLVRNRNMVWHARPSHWVFTAPRVAVVTCSGFQIHTTSQWAATLYRAYVFWRCDVSRPSSGTTDVGLNSTLLFPPVQRCSAHLGRVNQSVVHTPLLRWCAIC